MCWLDVSLATLMLASAHFYLRNWGAAGLSWVPAGLFVCATGGIAIKDYKTMAWADIYVRCWGRRGSMDCGGVSPRYSSTRFM